MANTLFFPGVPLPCGQVLLGPPLFVGARPLSVHWHGGPFVFEAGVGQAWGLLGRRLRDALCGGCGVLPRHHRGRAAWLELKRRSVCSRGKRLP